ncbi:MAG TPA: hypothetical protein VKZ53_23180 [Candidatus Angelobacter sp.]|nr:hypothetical protein [Candidatus Angelobacter sp.]
MRLARLLSHNSPLSMIIDDLIHVVPPPQSPKEGGTNLDWARITNLFGKPLPTDYMIFIERYGSGQIGGWLSVLNPFSKNPNISLTEQFFHLLASVSQLKEEFPESCPFPLLFEPGGLLPWGISIDGDIFCWQTAGVSGRWSVVVLGRHSDPEVFQYPFSQFLAKCITGEISCLAVASYLRANRVEFTCHEL